MHGEENKPGQIFIFGSDAIRLWVLDRVPDETSAKDIRAIAEVIEWTYEDRPSFGLRWDKFLEALPSDLVSLVSPDAAFLTASFNKNGVPTRIYLARSTAKFFVWYDNDDNPLSSYSKTLYEAIEKAASLWGDRIKTDKKYLLKKK